MMIDPIIIFIVKNRYLNYRALKGLTRGQRSRGLSVMTACAPLLKHGKPVFTIKRPFREDKNQRLSDLPHLSLLDTADGKILECLGDFCACLVVYDQVVHG